MGQPASVHPKYSQPDVSLWQPFRCNRLKTLPTAIVFRQTPRCRTYDRTPSARAVRPVKTTLPAREARSPSHRSIVRAWSDLGTAWKTAGDRASCSKKRSPSMVRSTGVVAHPATQAAPGAASCRRHQLLEGMLPRQNAGRDRTHPRMGGRTLGKHLHERSLGSSSSRNGINPNGLVRFPSRGHGEQAESGAEDGGLHS